jgi:hypothetical protein
MCSVCNKKKVFSFDYDQPEHEVLKQQQINCGEYLVLKISESFDLSFAI